MNVLCKVEILKDFIQDKLILKITHRPSNSEMLLGYGTETSISSDTFNEFLSLLHKIVIENAE
jgi:hypothetical protein